MQITTYLGFTLLSILIQFCVMDFIQGILKVQENVTDLKGTSQRKHLRDVLKDITYKPHALYYQTLKRSLEKKSTPAKFISNNTLVELLATTEITTVIDLLYEDNSTTTNLALTTESLYTTTEYDNITEITFFETKNETATKPDSATKKTIVTKECKCNILYQVCDINCCCDGDCSEDEIQLFPNCGNDTKVSKPNNICYADLPFFSYGNGLFCIVKINLPEERNLIYSEIDITPTEHFLTWKNVVKSHSLYEYTNKFYTYGDPIWLLKNGSIYHIDLPAAKLNNYCSGRKPMEFLKDEKYNCNVKIRDLEMLQIAKSLEEASVISATAQSMNSSVLNCTNLHCVNWTIIVCDNTICTNFKKDLHEPLCTELNCANLALRIAYTFYYKDAKIINATVHFYMQNVTLDLPYLVQQVEVKFILANESINQIISLSGNPGYIEGLPIIVSYAARNYTDSFFNSTFQSNKNFVLPKNIDGLCASANISQNIILFGKNRRMKCRYNYTGRDRNSTNVCQLVQNNMNKLMESNSKAFISPLGNPRDLKDEEWVAVQKSESHSPVYGEIYDGNKLRCFNLITRFSLVFAFVHLNGDNRIVSCKLSSAAVNRTFSLDDLSAVVTIDVNFLDVTEPGVMQQTPGPHLNLHIPKDFFYPFRSNKSYSLHYNLSATLLYCLTIIVVARK